MHELFSVIITDINTYLDKQARPETDPQQVLPKEYHEFLNVFSRKASDELPKHKSFDYCIELKEDPEKELRNPPLYSISTEELRIVKKYLEDNLNKGFIEVSSSPIASPVLFVRKPEEGLRFCVDYRKLNTMTRKNRYPLLLIEDPDQNDKSEILHEIGYSTSISSNPNEGRRRIVNDF